MRRLLQLIAITLAGYVLYEFIRRWTGEREAALTGPGSSSRPMPEPMGTVPGAAMTAGGAGAIQRTLGPDGSTVTERVGRGVVRRNQG